MKAHWELIPAHNPNGGIRMNWEDKYHYSREAEDRDLLDSLEKVLDDLILVTDLEDNEQAYRLAKKAKSLLETYRYE